MEYQGVYCFRVSCVWGLGFLCFTCFGGLAYKGTREECHLVFHFILNGELGPDSNRLCECWGSVTQKQGQSISHDAFKLASRVDCLLFRTSRSNVVLKQVVSKRQHTIGTFEPLSESLDRKLQTTHLCKSGYQGISL